MSDTRQGGRRPVVGAPNPEPGEPVGSRSFDLLRTKLHRPPVTAETVRRERLHEVMERALELPLSVVSAPAGTARARW